MNRASPVEMRKALKVVDVFKKAGILFVPMPVINEKDQEDLVANSSERLEVMATKIEVGEGE